MIDPVTCADGHSYERENIEKWLAVQHTSPLTGASLQHLGLTPNHALHKAIQEWLDQQGGPSQLHDVRPPPGPAPPTAQSSKLRISAPPARAPPGYRMAPPAPVPLSAPLAKGTERPTTPLKGAPVSRPTTPVSPSVVGAVKQRVATASKVAPQSPTKPPAKAPLNIKQPPIIPARPLSAGKSKVEGEGARPVVSFMQQRVRPHPKVAGTRVATAEAATPSTESEHPLSHPLSDVLSLHSWLGCMFALCGKTSATAVSTPAEAVHIFCSGLIFIVFTVCAQLMLFDDDGVPLVRLNAIPATAVTAVVASATSVSVACMQRFVFAIAKMPAQIGLVEKIAWRSGAWTLNLLLYAGGVAGSYLMSHYKLSLEEESVDFSPRAALAVLLNLLVFEPLLIVAFLVAIVTRRGRRPERSNTGADETTPPFPKKSADLLTGADGG